MKVTVTLAYNEATTIQVSDEEVDAQNIMASILACAYRVIDRTTELSSLKNRTPEEITRARMRHIREICQNCVDRDQPTDARRWLAYLIINILDGLVDEA